jgi:hypothetical protein
MSLFRGVVVLSVSVSHALAAHARACKSHGTDSPEAIAARYRLRVERSIDRVCALVDETPRLTEADRRRLLDALEPLLSKWRSPARPESDRVVGE